MELYKKYRPKEWEAIVGNTVAVNSLRKMVERDKLPQALLLHGPSGCGKTTLARIIQDKLGCRGMDCMEMNSSSYRGIDSIRELNRLSQLCPLGKCRVWILDEVHKLTNDAQHAMLKILEDTPASTYIVMCTTNPEKLIKPIRTRCCDMQIDSLSRGALSELLYKVAGSEGLELGEDVCDEILDVVQGSARTMLVLVDRLLHLKPKDWDEVIKMGAVDDDPQVIHLCRALLAKKPWNTVAKVLRGLDADPEKVRWAVLGYAKAVLLKTSNQQAFVMIDAFAEPFYETKQAGLVAACFIVIVGS